MTREVLLVSRDHTLRTRLAEALLESNRNALTFADPSAAFLCACGRIATLSAAIVDLDVGRREVADLIRRLRALRPALPILVSRHDTVGTEITCSIEAEPRLGEPAPAGEVVAPLRTPLRTRRAAATIGMQDAS